MHLNLALVHALQIDLVTEVEKKGRAICSPGRCHIKPSWCRTEGFEGREPERIFPVPWLWGSPGQNDYRVVFVR